MVSNKKGNMKLEQQVTSLEISKRLKELRVKQESLYKWADFTNHCTVCSEKDCECQKGKYHSKQFQVLYDNRLFGEIEERDYIEILNVYSAFTVAELGEMLPKMVRLNGECDWWSQKCWDSEKWQAQYRYDINTKQVANTEADARGKMLIYLLENKLITL